MLTSETAQVLNLIHATISNKQEALALADEIMVLAVSNEQVTKAYTAIREAAKNEQV